MYSYSPIKSIYLKNFRNLGEVMLDFTESPIIALVGENEAGKTSIVKGFAVCALHAYAREQKEYIRDNTNGFGIAIELEDGSLITRMKTATLNQYQVKFANGDVWETNKIDSGLPVQVQELMGLLEESETKEFLQIRTYEDQLLFVVTPASTNYKVMYDALKVDQLTKAIKVGSREVNSLKADITNNESSIYTLTNNLRGIRLYDLEPLLNIRNRLNEQLKVVDKLEVAISLLDRIEEARKKVGAIDLIKKYNIDEINVVEADKLVSINRILNEKSKLSNLLSISNKLNTAESIDLTTIIKMRDIIEKSDSLKVKIDRAKNLVKVSELSEIKEYEVNQLSRAIRLINSIDESRRQLARVDTTGCQLIEQRDFDTVFKISRVMAMIDRNKLLVEDVGKRNVYVQQVEAYLKQCGAKVVNCTKCGESIVLDSDSLEVHSH